MGFLNMNLSKFFHGRLDTDLFLSIEVCCFLPYEILTDRFRTLSRYTKTCQNVSSINVSKRIKYTLIKTYQDKARDVYENKKDE